jgi:enamine deaminase RidA (YjgF/YER057c/UK114 family)
METVFERFHYAPAVRVGPMLHVSGQVGRDEVTLEIADDPEAQMVRALENLGMVLRAAGAGYEDVVELVSYHVDIGSHIRTFVGVKDRYFAAAYPAWTAIGVTALAQQRLLVEVRAVACVPGAHGGPRSRAPVRPTRRAHDARGAGARVA